MAEVVDSVEGEEVFGEDGRTKNGVILNRQRRLGADRRYYVGELNCFSRVTDSRKRNGLLLSRLTFGPLPFRDLVSLVHFHVDFLLFYFL